MLNTGLRTGEALGLLNSDIDLENRVIHLQRGVKEVSRREGTESTSGREVKIGLCASLGLLTPERAARLREAGFTSYHHNLETSASHFSSICTTHAYEQDLETVRVARSAGFRVCSCGIFGLGETWEQRIELSQTLTDLGVDSLPLNFLNPIPGTPLGDSKSEAKRS